MDALHTIARNLTKKRQTVSCAESCTGGMLAAAFTSVAGSSQWFDQSFVTYSNKAKEDRLGVLPETLLEHGAVSRQTVYEMARGAKAVAQADYAVGIQFAMVRPEFCNIQQQSQRRPLGRVARNPARTRRGQPPNRL